MFVFIILTQLYDSLIEGIHKYLEHPIKYSLSNAECCNMQSHGLNALWVIVDQPLSCWPNRLTLCSSILLGCIVHVKICTRKGTAGLFQKY